MNQPDHPQPLPDYYAIVEVPPDASTTQIDQKIRQQLRTWQRRTTSPDLTRRQQAERQVELLARARAILLNDQARRRYDQQLARDRPDETPQAAAGTAGEAAPWPSATSHPTVPMSAAPGPVPAQRQQRRPVILGAAGLSLATVGAAAQMLTDAPPVFAFFGVIGALGCFAIVALTPDVDPRRHRRGPREGDMP